MRWLIVLLLTPFVLLAGLVGQPIGTPPTHVSVPTIVVRVAPVPTVVVTAAPIEQPGAPLVEQLVSVARSWLGVPYLWGGCTRHGVDCSCFVRNVLAVLGVQVPRTTVEQQAFDRPVSRGELRPGDTLFFNDTCRGCGANPTHEGLYLGGGLMIEAGDPVQLARLDEPYWAQHFAGAGRAPGL